MLLTQASALPLPDLAKPLRPFFVHPATSSPPQIPADPPYTPIICLSASRWVGSGSMDEIPSVTRLSSRTTGFDYVQGAGDDDELWGRGLKPALFHANKQTLLESDRDSLPQLVDSVVSTKHTLIRETPSDSARPQDRPLIPFLGPSSLLCLDIGPPTGSKSPPSLSQAENLHIIRVVETEKMKGESVFNLPYGEDTTIFRCPSAKADPKTYGKALESLIDLAYDKAKDGIRIVLTPGHPDDFPAAKAWKKAASQTNAGRIPACEPVEPLPSVDPRPEHRKTILPLAQLLCLGVAELNAASDSHDLTYVTKKDIAEVLQGLVSLWPDGNPPRAALKRVNEALMSE